MAKHSAHFNKDGKAEMVDVSDKAVTCRAAVAEGNILMNLQAFEAVAHGTAEKGDVLGVARVAGIMAAKQTAQLIPLCHPVSAEQVSVTFSLDAASLSVCATCAVRAQGKTGVEMEALCGASLALLTIYDMCKSLDRAMEISGVCLLEKRGGKSGHYIKGAP